MKTKKSKKADIDRLRGLFFRAGLLVSILFVIWAFRLTSEENNERFGNGMTWEDESIEIPPIKQPERKKEKQKTAKLNKVDDNKKTDDTATKVFNNEFNPFDSNLIIFHEVETLEVKVEPIIVIAEYMPEFPGGEAALFQYLDNNVKYPEMELQAGIEGISVVYFVVEKDGSITNVSIAGGRGNTPNMNREAIRVIKNMPNWSPGKQRNKKVRVSIKIPIRYQINY